jgi:hypothetical protein
MYKVSQTTPYNIFIAGNYDKAVASVRNYCDQFGFCVTVTPTNYVYTGGEEDGVIVGLINYPRFPKTSEELRERAITIAKQLLEDLEQQSFSIQGPDRTEWFSWREEDLKELELHETIVNNRN